MKLIQLMILLNLNYDFRYNIQLNLSITNLKEPEENFVLGSFCNMENECQETKIFFYIMEVFVL